MKQVINLINKVENHFMTYNEAMNHVGYNVED